MNANPEESEPGSRPTRGSGREREQVGTRASQYMIAPAGSGPADPGFLERLRGFGGVEIVRNIVPRAMRCPPVTVVRMTPDKAAALARSARGALVIEPDEPLRAASLAAAPAVAAAPAMPLGLGPGFTTTIQVVDQNGAPVEQAEVQLIGQAWTAQGLTGSDGKVGLTLYRERPDRVAELRVEPRHSYWGLCRSQPKLQPDTVNIVSVRPVTNVDEPGWGERAMRLDRLPQEPRGAGVKIALIDTGVATSHRQLRHIERGFATAGVEARSWSQDAAGHGTPCAGIIAARRPGNAGVRGYASAAEFHVCKVSADGWCSDLVEALDYCVGAGIDVACLGFGCQRGSVIAEHCIAITKQQGVALIAAAGNTGGPVEFPACSRHALAVGGVGQAGSFPADSQPADQPLMTIDDGRGLFIPAFSCKGPELDLCAPAVAVISCQAPDGYGSRDGTSLAAAHVAALAALIIAHHADFQREFANRDERRVKRLFQILKATAQPLADPIFSGAGLPDAAAALGLPSEARLPLAASGGLEAMRSALRRAGLGAPVNGTALLPQPPRGPAEVTHLPLRPAQAPMAAGLGGGLHDLRAAMLMAGLSAGR
jgi:subtilisin